jgi:beta-lactam-binding protein with PASTA domain/predicted Ser/Thr protein kinase
MAEISPGVLIDGRYRVISRLGAGGMADVFLAEDQQLRRNVALKLLHRRFAEDPGFVERFRREAQAAAGLQHPNVVSVYDRGEFDGTYYIAMEYLQGRSLKQLVREDAPLDPIRAIDLTIQILQAARFAHRRGVIHRDLKPHNVIVDDADNAKVTDFGIARAGASDMTETGSIMGTAQYLSPEQAQGHAVSETSDLYSVGVVLYELLTGHLPFDAEAAVTIALKHVSEAPPAPTTLNPKIPPELEQIVLWALNKDPAHRPANADQFIAALEQAKAVIASGQSGQRTASMAALAAVGGGDEPTTMLAAAAAGETAAPVPEAWAGDPVVPVEEPPPDHQRRSRWPWVALALLVLVGAGVAAYLLTRPVLKVVPTVVNENVSVAQTQIQNAGFTPNLIYRMDRAANGTVIGQNPLGGSRADQGSTVTLTVSQGPGSVPVPSVSNLSERAAEQAIRQAKLKVGRIQSENSDTIASGNATRTDPGAGVALPVGSAVTLFVSSGKAKVSVPDVKNQTEAAARATLTQAGFSVTTSKQTSSTIPAGTVINQSPASGSQAAPGSTVALVIAQAPTTAKVPDVTGDSLTAATSALTAAGFKVTKQTKTVTKANQDGIVVTQSPAAGGTATKGSAVTVTVGHYVAPTPTTPTTTTTTPTTTTTTPK